MSDSLKRHQKIDIPLIKSCVTEYQLRHKLCTKCRKKYKARLYDCRLIGSFGGFFNNSKRDIQEILSKIFNVNLSLGLISTTEGRISKKVENKYNELSQMAQNSSYLHLDETSSNNKGKTLMLGGS